MSRYLFYAIVIITLGSCQVKPKAISDVKGRTCQELKTGTFKIKHKLFGMETLIVRSDSIQTETTEFSGTSFKFTYNVRWLNDCMYELTPNPYFQNDVDLTGERMIVKINKVEGNTLYYRTYRNGSRLRSHARKMMIID